MKKFTVQKIAIINGKSPKLNTEIELDEKAKSTQAYLKAGFIKEVVLKDDTAPLTADAIEAMNNAQLRVKVKELGLETEDQRSITLKAALLATIESEPQDDEIKKDDKEDEA